MCVSLEQPIDFKIFTMPSLAELYYSMSIAFRDVTLFRIAQLLSFRKKSVE